MRVVIRNWNGGTQNIDSTPGCAADCTYSLTKYADFYLDYHAHFVYDSPLGPNTATIYIHNGIWCVEAISCDKSVAYPPLPNDDHRCGRVNAYQICIIPASGPISQPMRVVIRNWNGGTQNIDSTPGCAADCTYSLTKYADFYLDYHAHFVYDSPLGPNPATIYIHNGIWCVEGLSCGTMPPKQPTPPNTPLLASKLKWFPNTPLDGFHLTKGGEFQLAALDPSDNPGVRRVLFFVKWPNRPWQKLCNVSRGDALHPAVVLRGTKGDRLYSCDGVDQVIDGGDVQFSFDVDGPGPRVATHPDGIRTGQNDAYTPCNNSNCVPKTRGMLGPNDFRRAYAVHGGARNVRIGIILAGMPVSPADLAVFAYNTQTPKLRTSRSGPDTVEWRFIGNIAEHRGANARVAKELAMDVEYAHAMAPGSHLVVWLVPIFRTPNPNFGIRAGDPNSGDYSLAIEAAIRSKVPIVSNSWFEINPSCPPTSTNYAYIRQADDLTRAAKSNQTFFVSSGDHGKYSGCSVDPLHSIRTKLADFPAISPNVVAVGGTSLLPGKGEFAWGSLSADYAQSSGGGCEEGSVRPKWQMGIRAYRCTGRAIPDVAAAGDNTQPAYVVYGDQVEEYASGTSLSAPLWAGMAADLESYLKGKNKPPTGFMAPGIYHLANNPVTGPRDFHDITAYAPGEETGNGFPVGKGWDEVTGWGSPNLAHLEEDWAATDGGLHAPPDVKLTPTPTGYGSESESGGGTVNGVPFVLGGAVGALGGDNHIDASQQGFFVEVPAYPTAPTTLLDLNMGTPGYYRIVLEPNGHLRLQTAFSGIATDDDFSAKPLPLNQFAWVSAVNGRYQNDTQFHARVQEQGGIVLGDKVIPTHSF